LIDLFGLQPVGVSAKVDAKMPPSPSLWGWKGSHFWQTDALSSGANWSRRPECKVHENSEERGPEWRQFGAKCSWKLATGTPIHTSSTNHWQLRDRKRGKRKRAGGTASLVFVLRPETLSASRAGPPPLWRLGVCRGAFRARIWPLLGGQNGPGCLMGGRPHDQRTTRTHEDEMQRRPEATLKAQSRRASAD